MPPVHEQPPHPETSPALPPHPEEGEATGESGYDDLYKRYMRSTTGNLASFQEQPKPSRSPSQVLLRTSSASTGIPPRWVDIAQDVQTSERDEEAEKKEHDSPRRPREPSQTQASSPRDIQLRGSRHGANTSSIISTMNLTPGQESRLKYLEDYFEVLPTDDDETAEIKRKLVSKMKHRRQLSLQKNSTQSDDEEDTQKPEEPAPPVSPYSELALQLMEEDDDGFRGQLLRTNSSERKSEISSRFQPTDYFTPPLDL